MLALLLSLTVAGGSQAPTSATTAIIQTAPSQDEVTRLAAEDEVRAAVVEHLVQKRNEDGGDAGFTLLVMRKPPKTGLTLALARRGIKLKPGKGRMIDVGGIHWTALDLVDLCVSAGSGMGSSGTTYVVALVDGGWKVVNVRQAWIT